MEPLLGVQNLTVSYGSPRGRRRVVLNDVSFTVVPRDAVGLLGESGCGKTTLALTLLNLLPHSGQVLGGSVVFGGNNLLDSGRDQLQKVRGAGISMVHQEPGMSLNPVIRVGDQVAEVLCAHLPISRQRAREQVHALLAEVGFTADSGIGEAYPHQLSGGQQQRVAIAQAIACRPPLMIADEPTTALDSATALEILTLLQNLKQKLGMAILLISHDPVLIARFVDRILVMYAGNLVEEGPAQRVISQPLHPYTQGLLHARPAGACHKQPLAPIPGEPPDLANLPAGCSFEPRCFERMEICRTCQPRGIYKEAHRQVACFKYAD